MLKLDSNGGCVSREGGTDDPNGTTDIITTVKSNGAPSGDDFVDVLQSMRNLHRSAIKTQLTLNAKGELAEFKRRQSAKC